MGYRGVKSAVFLCSGGTFYSTKTSRLNFWQRSESGWISIIRDFQKRRQPREVYPNFRRVSFRKFSFNSTLLLEFLEFSVE